MMKGYAIDKSLPLRAAVADTLMVAKPAIVALVLVSVLTGIYLAGRGLAGGGPVIWTLLGVGAATAGAAMLNNYIDRDIDRLMERTSTRALASGLLRPLSVLAAGTSLVLASMVVLGVFVNTITAILTMSAVFIYVVLYTGFLKRRTPLANQIGGLAGALPPVLGYVSVTGTLDMKAGALFLIMALWQQPHALSLAILHREDYRRASIPVVPVVKGLRGTKRRILAYAVLLLPAGVLPVLFSMAGPFYLYVSLVLGIAYVAISLRSLYEREGSEGLLFFYSIVYLTLLFTAMVVDIV